MKCVPHARPATWKGFTLVESIIVLVILAIAAAAIASLQGSIFYGQSDSKDRQVGVQLIQACAEQVLAVRRQSGYTAVNANTCSTLGSFGAYSASTLTITDPYSGTGCPSGGVCKLVSVTQGGLTPLTLLLVSY